MTEQSDEKPLIAIVDDEEDVLTYRRIALMDNGYRVITISNADEAVPTMVKQPPDAICLDLLMPRRMGISVYAEIVRHKTLSAVPTLILSGLAARHDLPGLLRGLPEPAGFLEKPVDIAMLLSKLEQALARRGEKAVG